jgi:predicted porin
VPLRLRTLTIGNLMKLASTIFISALLVMNSHSVFAADNAHHFPGVFIGYTNANDETHFTYGLEYEYKFNRTWGLGAVYEKIDNAHHGDGVTVKVAELFYHPLNSLRFGLGIGKEKVGGAHPHSEDLYRLSASYEYHVGDFGLEPTFAVDFIDGEQAYVLGVVLVRPF